MEQGLLEQISPATVWRWLREDAIKPWRYRSWIFPRDPEFEQKAGRVLDLYLRQWEGEPLGPDDYVICADEKSGIQVLERIHPTQAPHPGKPGRVEHEYVRQGTMAYLVALDVGTGQVVGKVEESTGVEPFMALVDEVMGQAPYARARRVFWVVDNGPSHHPSTFAKRLTSRYPNAIAVHLPKHASWLNQAELYFAIVQRKALTPNDFESPEDLVSRILGYQARYNATAKAFSWKFTRQDLLARLRLVS